jgi:hypothetical protein
MAATWQDEPTPGDWWVSIAPDKRRGFPAVVSCHVWPASIDGFVAVQYRDGSDMLPLDQDWFKGARWLKRETPADPFAADRATVTPRAGQVWQKLNAGTKTASKAPRITVREVDDRDVLYSDRYGNIARMRITTLQRDWHCLNPEV